ncbi:MAG: FAD-binding protein [Candidatus Zixiibacteriota bacterium]
MPDRTTFLKAVGDAFPDDRLTWQKTIPTFHPQSADEAGQIFRLANQHSQKCFITGFGNNIDPIGSPFDQMVTVRTDRLNNLMEVAEQDLYVKVGAGYPLKELNLDIAKSKIFLPHSDLPYVGSFGGGVAAGLSADLNGRDWPIKKYFIKAEIVTPLGEIITPGSVCFKSVSGYDIVKLYAGSWGLYGLITSLWFRVLPDTARHEFQSLTQKPLDRTLFLQAMERGNESTDAVYTRKIKEKFDPNGILPVV